MTQEITERWLICRICLKRENNKLYNIFVPMDEEEVTDLGTTLLDKIELCGAVKLTQLDNLPNKICGRCVLLLRAAYRFRDLCQQSQNQLEQFITPLPQKEETGETVEIDFDSDVEEQKNEVQEEVVNELLEDADYMIEENVLEYDESSFEPDHTTSAVEESNIVEIQVSSDDGNSHYVIDRNDYEITNFKCDESPNEDNIIIEDQPKKPSRQIITRSTYERKSAAKRKRTYSPVEKIDGFYNCIYCENRYTDKTKYNNHMKIHVRDMPHQCEICEKQFTTTPQLSRHMNTHTGNRPYKCQYCEASFADPSTKIKHERIHTNERPYKCCHCNKAFGYSNVLKVHMMTHTGEKPHICGICGRAFSQLHHKNAHEKRHSKVNVVMIRNSPEIEFIGEDI